MHSEASHERRIIGIDVGGTKIAAGIVQFPDGRLLARRMIPTQASEGGGKILAKVHQLAAELAGESERTGPGVQGIGIGLCELVDSRGAVASAHCIDWRGLPLVETLGSIAPTILEADVRAAALAESHFGAGAPFRIFIYITIGTGMSSCLVLNGQPYSGAQGLAGTFASSPLPRIANPSEPDTTLEQFAAGPALVVRYCQFGGAPISTDQVIAAAIRGDPKAVAVVQSAGEAAGVAIGWLINVLDPEAIVLGGGLGLAKGPYRNSLVDSVRRHTWSNLQRAIPIHAAALGNDAGVIGAALAAVGQLARDR